MRDRKLSSALSEGFYDALGHTIKVARTDLGIDRKVLAEMAGISYSYLAAIENGQKQPSSHVLLSLADALGLRTHELLESAEDRRVRGMTVSEDLPSWLAGRPSSPPVAGAAPMAAARGPEPAEAMYAAAPAPEPDRTEAFLEELVELARDLPEEDRQLLLHMARKLTRRPR